MLRRRSVPQGVEWLLGIRFDRIHKKIGGAQQLVCEAARARKHHHELAMGKTHICVLINSLL